MALFVGVTAPAVRAIDPDRLIEQYIHDRWEFDRGFPGGVVHAITQTSDGYLWIASEKGLVRFDGVRFRLFQTPGMTSGRDPGVTLLAPERSGGLWVGLRNAGLWRHRDDEFQELPAQLAALRPMVTAMSAGVPDTVFVASVGIGVFAYRGDRVDIIVPQHELANTIVSSIAKTGDGDVWIGTRDAGLLRVHGGQISRLSEGLPDQQVSALLPDGPNGLWIGTAQGMARWDGASLTRAGVPAVLKDIEVLSMIRDRDGNVWVGTAAGDLLRVNPRGVASLGPRDGDRRGAVNALFEDRDGNLWIGTPRGIERRRDGVFTTYSSGQGLPSGAYGPAFVDSDRTWVASADGGLYWIRDGQVGQVKAAGIEHDVVYSISGVPGELWLGRQRGGLTRLQVRGDTYVGESFGQAHGLPQNTVYAVQRAKDGSVWAGTLSGGVSRLLNGRFTTFTTADGLASNTVAAILETADGAIWLATPNGVSTHVNGVWRRFATADGLPSNDVNTLFEDSGKNVWIGTADGLALVRDGRVQRAFRPPMQLRASILGLAEDRTGHLWISTVDRVLRVQRDALARGTLADDAVREYGVSDGLLGLEGVKRSRSVIADAKGRIWLALNRGVSVTDPARAAHPAVPALAHVEELSVDGKMIERRAADTIAPRPQRITLAFTGLSLAVPERILFRYRLDGFDSDWSAPSATRQAVYTNLGPGSYRFHVIASDSDGAWNGPEATVSLSIVPTYWQTPWFKLVMAVLLAVSGWAAYRLRLMQMANQLNVRFEERLAERTRIAQELHDTLLQGFMSASMQLHVAADRLPGDSPAKASLAGILELMGRVIDEGRNAVRGLRSTAAGAGDLKQAFSQISGELGASAEIDYRVIVEGRPRPLKPVIRDEVYRIGREALSNAFRHAAAQRIEMEIEYQPSGLRMLVRDNGRGIDAQVLKSGVDGHWGLPGMRERADRIGAKFKVWSSADAGTEIELDVPARVAFVRENEL